MLERAVLCKHDDWAEIVGAANVSSSPEKSSGSRFVLVRPSMTHTSRDVVSGTGCAGVFADANEEHV